jgi:polyisoprenoid-binding protein YceI
MRTLIITSTLLLSLSALAETGVVVQANLSPAGNFQGKSAQVKGVATQKGDTVNASNIIIHLQSLNTGIELRDKHMKDKYLEVGKFPDAVLTEAHGQGGKGTGKLKIHGVEHEVTGTYEIVGGKELTANFPIHLSDYKIEGIRYMGVGVKDEANITVTLPLQQAK